jgi:hypothetical protein
MFSYTWLYTQSLHFIWMNVLQGFVRVAILKTLENRKRVTTVEKLGGRAFGMQ